ncbi:selenocysteine-specific translation elongation factor [Dehalobacterium formicoaceticum]|uniref:Selenocysteine-specific elongation factor n=1 Tax=Dehalobacterium formicoaceticum TaxID=51515 RepID=A0ABT1Y425_9FIRM|nr:selenocysteine-specific translation elongation factor [Dehalobacterium formicoaceticum]MCR6545630.1 selenocysteine-specific translation elongation factor [Dehalobacterium formicoaceticum]
MQRIIIGTAGHVDHGKTVLTKKLTGVDTDRLKEEKKRGISIELGFAPLTLPSGTQVGLVDVPGHERFIKNMLAGIAGIDLVLLIIAGDEGVMPQTREHLDIIDLLEVKNGIVVVTKSDLVDEEWLELLHEEIKEAMVGTVLENAPIIPVSAFTGQGIPDLLAMIDKMAQEMPPKMITGKMRLPVDRVFTITGFGTVATGTLWSGRLKVGDTVEILPGGQNARVRNLQVHGAKVTEAIAGQRVAVNLAGVEMEEIDRGCVLAQPELLTPTHRIDVKLHLLKHVEHPLEQRARIRVHHGTQEVLGRVQFLDREELQPGDSCFCQIVLETPLMPLRGDHYVVRSYSPMITIGGGTIVDSLPAKHKRYQDQVMENLALKFKGEPKDLVLQELSEDQVGLVMPKDIASRTGMEESLIQEILSELTQFQEISYVHGEGTSYYFLKAQEEAWLEITKKRLGQYHHTYPLRSGMPKEDLRSRDFSHLPGKIFNLLIERWLKAEIIKGESQSLALLDFAPQITPPVAQAIQLIEEELLKEPYSPPGWDELAEKAGLKEEEKGEIMTWLIKNQHLVKVSDEVIFHQKAFHEAKERIINYLREHGSIQLAETRDLLKTSRKYALPLLEYLDQSKITIRKGDQRLLKNANL